jgi:hypothetical protein
MAWENVLTSLGRPCPCDDGRAFQKVQQSAGSVAPPVGLGCLVDAVPARGVWRCGRRRGIGHGSGPEFQRDIVEQTVALPHWLCRLHTQWRNRDDIHEAFVIPARATSAVPRPSMVLR